VGYEAREATTPTWWIDHLHPEDRPRVEREVRRLLTDGRLTTEYRFRRKDGSYAWVQDDSRLLLDAAGKPGEVFGAWLDVAERRQAEEALRESEQRFRELADNVREVFFVADPETGQALYLSPAYEEVFGRSREHAYGDHGPRGARAGSAARRRAVAGGHRGDAQGRRARGRAHQAAPRVQPPAGARATRRGLERARGRPRQVAAQLDRRGHRAAHDPRRGPGRGAGRPRAAPAGHPQPRRERPRRHAQGRKADDRDAER